MEPDLSGWSDDLDCILSSIERPEHLARFRALLEMLVHRRPKLSDPHYYPALWLLTRFEPVRPLEQWQPQSKGSYAAFRALCAHLWYRFAPPPCFHAIFGKPEVRWYRGQFRLLFDLHSDRLAALGRLIGRGEGRAEAIEAGLLWPTFTKKMWHLLVCSKVQGDPLRAIREAQVLAHGGSQSLVHGLCGSPLGREFMDQEVFWDTVIQWLCQETKRRASIEAKDVGPLFDYLKHRKTNQPDFSIKGRSLGRVVASMEAWHEEIALEKRVAQSMFEPSGYPQAQYEVQGDTPEEPIRWSMEELLSSRAVVEEGRHHRHCVRLYVDRVAAKRCAIWRLNRAVGDGEPKSVLTIEVDLRRGEIVQIRGRLNRLAKRTEMSIIKRWAQDAQLRISGYA